MPKSTDIVPGRKINDVCPQCTRGRLRPITRHDKGSNGICGPAGRSWDRNLIERLACNNCSACFEVIPSQRGEDLKAILLRQTEGFTNPERKPDACPHCGLIKLTQDKTFKPHPFHTGREYGNSGPGDWTNYLYCEACYVVCWVKTKHVPRQPGPQEIADAKAIEEQINAQLGK